MKNIPTYLNFLNEEKQVGVIYHFTNAEAAESILGGASKGGVDSKKFPQSERILFSTHRRSTTKDGSRQFYISFTRNYDLHNGTLNDIIWGAVRICLDGTAISNYAKISPFLDSEHGIRRSHEEQEERALGKRLEIRRKDVIQIDIHRKEFIDTTARWAPVYISREKAVADAEQELSAYAQRLKDLGFTVNIVDKYLPVKI